MKATHMKTITGVLLTFTAACLAVPAFAQTSAREYSLEIERQPVADALIEFSRQTGLQFGYFPENPTEKILVGPLSGRYTADAAITQLLLPSGLSFERLNERTIAVTGPACTKSQRLGFLSTERKTDHRMSHSFVRLADLRLAEAPATEEDEDLAQRTAANARKSDRKKPLEEVIVTAQRREENLQKVPISISVLGGDLLDRSTVQGVREALNTVPGVSISTNQNDSPVVTVRGVAPGVARFGGSGVTGYYLDTIPFSLVKSAIVPDSNAYDLERVEVLRGPQGTLYGASALNGVMRVLTKDANPDAFELKARALTSNTEEGDWNYGGDLAVNLPIVEGKLAARAVVGYQDLSGWIDRPNREDANDAENRNFRFRLNAQPTEELSIGLHAWLSRISRGATSLADDNGQNANLMDEPNSDDYDAYGLRIGYEFPWFSVVSMTSHMNYRVETNLDATPYAFPVLLRNSIDADVSSQEVLFTSAHGGSWRWSIGAIYRDAEDRLISRFPTLSSTPTSDDRDRSESYAVYGEVTRIFFDGGLELTGGLRYFEDDVELRDGLSTTSASSMFSSASPRVVLTWRPSDDLTVYSSYAEGFRSGAQQSPRVVRLGVPAPGPDTLKNYELGAKGSLLGGRVSFDAALYYMDWQDVQQSLTVFVATAAGNTPAGALINSESASGVGLDLGMTAQPIDGLTLGASVSWNDLTLDADVFSRGVVFAEKGDRLNNSPELSFGVSADYVFPLGGSGFEGRLSASMNHVSKLLGNSILGAYVGDPISIGRASFSIYAPNHWGATLFVDNIGNEQDSIFVADNPIAPPPSGTPHLHTRPRPRTVGLQLEYQF